MGPSVDFNMKRSTTRAGAEQAYQAIRNAEPLSQIRGWQQTANLWRRFERLDRWPEGFVAVGDAVRAFNPVYGQGMTVAATTAVALDRALSDHRQRHGDDLAGFARPFQRLVGRHGADAWQLSPARTCGTRPPRGPVRVGWAGSPTGTPIECWRLPTATRMSRRPFCG